MLRVGSITTSIPNESIEQPRDDRAWIALSNPSTPPVAAMIADRNRLSYKRRVLKSLEDIGGNDHATY